jgi:anti-anti-sigma factor
VDLAPAPVPSLTLCTRGEGSAVIVELRGELDLTCSPDLRDQLLGLLRRRSARLVLDLSKVTYCDASGLAVLVGTARRASLLAGSVRLAAVSHQVDRALQVTGLHRHLDVFATVEAAIASPQGIMASPIGTVRQEHCVARRASNQACRSARFCASRGPGRHWPACERQGPPFASDALPIGSTERTAAGCGGLL